MRAKNPIDLNIALNMLTNDILFETNSNVAKFSNMQNQKFISKFNAPNLKMVHKHITQQPVK